VNDVILFCLGWISKDWKRKNTSILYCTVVNFINLDPLGETRNRIFDVLPWIIIQKLMNRYGYVRPGQRQVKLCATRDKSIIKCKYPVLLDTIVLGPE
jgi:hypothetical protein